MALRVLGAKLSERIFPRHLVKGLTPLQQRAKTTVPLVNSCKKTSVVPRTEKPTVSERQCKCDPDCSRWKNEEFVYRMQVFTLLSICLAATFNLYSIVQLNSAHKTLEDLKMNRSQYK